MISFRFALSGPAGRLAPAQPGAGYRIPPLPRYSVGLAVHSSAYHRLGGGAYQGTTIPVQVTAGYQLRPRLAVQLGVAYSSTPSNSSTSTFYYYPTPGSPRVYYSSTSRGSERRVSAALLGRYTLTRQPAHRFQADLLGGVTLETYRYTVNGIRSDSSRSPVTASYNDQGTNQAYLLTAGPSVRYRLGRHLEALLDFTLNYNLRRGGYYAATGLTGATALGLRYRFGKR
ncbi:MAG: hypothetical protein WKG07_31700 [Hymenobacter sp.]